MLANTPSKDDQKQAIFKQNAIPTAILHGEGGVVTGAGMIPHHRQKKVQAGFFLGFVLERGGLFTSDRGDSGNFSTARQPC